MNGYEEKGLPLHFHNDSFHKVCDGMRRKAIDGQWLSERHQVKFDNTTDWLKVFKRDCLGTAHGGKACYGPNEVKLEWVRVISEPLSWNDAKSKCQNMGGKLFHSLNGTQEQLEFLYERAGHQKFFLGISTHGGNI